MQQDLDLNNGGAAESYPLSPLQQGMVFHRLYQHQPGVDLEQLIVDLDEALDLSSFFRAWEAIVQRHAIFRTSFRWHGLPEPLQEVQRKVEVLWERMDWRDLSVRKQKVQLEAWLESERRRGIDLGRAPLMRLSLIQTGPRRHLLVWTFHHLLLDGRSLVVLWNELFGFYDALAAGYEMDLVPPAPYRRYIEWVHSQDGPKAETFWRGRLQGFAHPTRLACASNDPLPAPASEPKEFPVELTAAKTAALRAAAESAGLTLNTLVQGAWALTLSRYSGEEDVLFGAVRACRHGPVPGIDRMVGLLINTVPVRTLVKESDDLRPWLRGLRDQWIALREFEHTPLVRVQEWSQVPRGQGLFECLLNFQDPSWDAVLQAQGGPWLRRHFELRSFPNYPLVLDGCGGSRLKAKILYDPGRYPEWLIVSLAHYWKQLLEQMDRVMKEGGRVRDLPSLTARDAQRTLLEWNQTRLDWPGLASVPALIEKQTRLRPNKTAVADERREITYRHLNFWSARVGQRLRELGVRAGDVVGVLLGHRVELVAALLGTWKARAAYLPLDPSFPQERLKLMLADAEARILITHSDRLEDWAGFKGCVLDVGKLEPSGAEELPAGLPALPSGNELAYVIYTSGSTGVPKGVENHHHGLLNLVQWHVHAYGVTPSDRATCLASPAYDASVWEIWPYLAAGASVHMPDAQTRLHPARLAAWLARQRITLCYLPTPLAHVLLDEVWPPEMQLRAVLTGGERLQRRPSEDFPCAFVNHYGPTENAVVTTSAPVTLDFPEGVAPPIGRPIANTRVYLLDRHLHPVPLGVPGELHIGGAGLARGYRCRPALTAERFIPDPFESEPGGRLYKTGDIARFLPDGQIEFLGRSDQQVKIRGHRVELGEIEQVLLQHPNVREAVVVARTGPTGSLRLAAGVVGRTEQELARHDLLAFLRKKLPEPMLPSAFIFLKGLPLTDRGKVDRNAVAGLFEASSQTPAPSVPRTPIEEALVAIWSECLQREPLGIHDHFFECGGHSLLATRVISRVYEMFGCDLPVQDLFECPTVAQFAGRLDAALRAETMPQPPALRRQPGAAASALSFAQERLWFLEQLEPGRSFNNVPLAVRLQGELNVGALERAFQQTAHRHHTLRTVFESVDGKPAARVLEDFPVRLPVDDLSSWPVSARAPRARQLAAEEARHGFDASQPLWRARLFRLDSADHLLALNFHHMICDGWSMEIFFRELTLHYESACGGRPSPLSELPLQYADYAAWQRDWMRGERLEGQLAYWKEQLRGLPSQIILPADFPRPRVQSYAGAKVFFALPTPLCKAIRAQSRSESVTRFVFLLAAFYTLLRRYSHQEDIAVGSPVAGRRRTETEGLIGLFANTLVLRCQLPGQLRFRELLQRVHQMAIRAFARQDAPFEKLVEALQPDRDLSRAPLFQVMFVFQQSPLSPSIMGGVECRPEPQDSGTSKFDLTLSLEERGEDLSGFVEYSTGLFEESTMTRLLSHYQTLLESAVKDPNQSIESIPVLTPSELAQIVVEWNDTDQETCRGESLPELFARQACLRPHSVAVEFGKKQLLYGELEAQANHLAARLRALGARPEGLVGLLLDPSLELMTGLLGTLKAGCAYVPLDPAFPRERLDYMAADARPEIIITQSHLRDRVPSHGGKVLVLDSPGSATLESGPAPGLQNTVRDTCLKEIRPAIDGHPGQLAYVIYTSGSTGRPKGVCVSHRSLANVLQAMQRELRLNPWDTLLAVSSLSFDIAALELFLPLIAGARVALIPRSAAADPSALAAHIRATGATFMQATPSAWRLLLEHGWEGQRSLHALCGGEPMPPSLATALRERCASVYNLYGPTETTVWSALHRLASNTGPIPIGRPIANTQLYILDRLLQPVPAGVPGELYIAGDGVARGYWNQPDLTAERFLPDPFAAHGGGRLYRTGDLARWRPEGQVEFLGRNDGQVKWHGYRIELGEIESALCEHPSVAQALAAVRPDETSDERLVAYLALRKHRGVSFDELREALERKLPSYMVPSTFVILDTLPRTPNGKADRAALPAPSCWKRVARPVKGRPKSAVESVLARLWRQVFGERRIGVQDNFFKLGGHSLLAVQMAARLRELFKMEFPVRAVFEAPTIEQQARWMAAHEAQPGRTEQIARLILQVSELTSQQTRQALTHSLSPSPCMTETP